VSGGDKDKLSEAAMYIRKVILSAVSAFALVSPVAASDLSISLYTDRPSYERETRTYEQRTETRSVVVEPAPVHEETVVVRRHVLVPPRVVVEEHPVYVEPQVYAAPPAYVYASPRWHREGWGRKHFYGGW